MEKQRIISITVDNVSGIINKVTGLIMRKGFSIDSLAVCQTENTNVSSMTITLSCDDKGLERAVKQLDTLIDVVKVEVLDENNSISREHILIKAKVAKDMEEMIKRYHADIIKKSEQEVVIEFTGETKDALFFLKEMMRYEIITIARSGKIAVSF